MKFYTTPTGIDLSRFPDVYPLLTLRTLERYDGPKRGIVDANVIKFAKRDRIPLERYPLRCAHRWVIPDYPEDLGYSRSIERTRENILKFWVEPNAIPVVQFRLHDYSSFLEGYYWTVRYATDVLGIGNLCRCFHNGKEKRFATKVVDFLGDHPAGLTYHIFGAPTHLIRHILTQGYDNFSVDNTKWTRIPDARHAPSCSKNSREAYLTYYLHYLGAP